MAKGKNECCFLFAWTDVHIYIYTVSNQNFEIRQDGWLKGKMNGAVNLPGLMVLMV